MQQKPPRWNVSPALIAPEAQPLWKGLAFIAPLWPDWGGGILLNSIARPVNRVPTINGALWRGTPNGVGLGRVTGTADERILRFTGNLITTSDGAGTGDFTLVVLANPVNEAATRYLYGQRINGSNPRMLMSVNTNDAGVSAGAFRVGVFTPAGNQSVAAENMIDGKDRLYGMWRRGSLFRAYRDGIVIGETTSAAQQITYSGNESVIGGLGGSSTQGMHSSSTMGGIAAWNRALSDAEMRLLARDPFCMFRPQAEWRGVWTPLAGGDIALNPADLTDIFGYETPAFSQAHYLSAADAAFGENWETPAFAQAHLFAPHEMNFALPFDLASLAMNSQGAPGFRVRSISADARSKNTGADARSNAIASGGRSRSITE